MTNATIECTRIRACKWQGTQKDLVRVKNTKESKKFKLDIYDAVCPKCGCKTTYNIPKK
jgi:hypothetical protein